MNVVLFEDEAVSRLYPITLGRPAYAISCGSFRLVDWLGQLGVTLRGVVRPHLHELQRIDFPELMAEVPSSEPVLLVNARLVPSFAVLRSLQRLIATGQPGAARTASGIAAAWLPAGSPRPSGWLEARRFPELLNSAALEPLPALDAELPLFEYPHDVIRHNMQILRENLDHRLATGEYQQLADGLFLAEGATLGQHVVHDTRQGPILLDRNATVGPFTFLRGPAYLGVGARVSEQAAIKDFVSLGHTTKIGGEVEASVVEPYTNKQHHGFLGHSYLGSWINLGAGTCNSDLKNTYGQVNMEYRGEKVASGMQFLGCIMGDYAKTAINTGIFTGKTIGVCSMIYGFVTTNVPSFVNYARLFGQVTELPPEVMIQSQQRMFARRKVSQRPCDIQLLHDMYDLTFDERQLAGEPLAL